MEYVAATPYSVVGIGYWVGGRRYLVLLVRMVLW
jgi:hypothetical protein